MNAQLSDLVGKTLVKIDKTNDSLLFETSDGKQYKLHHYQDCCESVYIESIVGDLSDLLGEPILFAEESASRKHPPGYTASEYEESFTWTFYKFATRKGYVDVRWFGESNGYYSESVEFDEVES